MEKIYKSSIICLVVLIASLFVNTTASFASEAIPVNDLVTYPEKYDKKKVTIKAEAIGESMIRKDMAWVNVSDGSNAIGIWMTKEDALKIKYFGDYKNKGDEVKVTGVYNKTCLEHGGDTDIHAESVEVVSAGSLVKEQIPSWKIVALVILLVISAALGVTLYKKNLNN